MTTLADLKKVLSAAKAVYQSDKSNKKAKKAFKKAKAAVLAAKETATQEAPNKKKRAAEDSEQLPKKKAKTGASLTDLKNAAKTAKAAWKADKENPKLKKAWKKAKKALAEGNAKDGEGEEAPVDLKALTTALKEAKNAWKADKSNKELKAKYKAAKGALAKAEPEKEGSKPEPEKEEPKKDNGSTDFLSSLKSKPKPASLKDRDSDVTPSTRMFCRNLSYDIDDDKAKAFFKDCGEIMDIYWVMDRDDGRFKGFGFVTFATQEGADKALALDGQDLLGRPIGISYSKQRGSKGGSRGGGGGGGNRGAKPLSEKQPGCTTIFCGNLSFEVDDAKITEYFSDCGAIRDIRWLNDRETGDFKGCGFIEFENPEVALDLAVKKNGSEFMGRNLRIDYSAPRAPR